MILKIALITQNKQNIFCFRLKKWHLQLLTSLMKKKLMEKEKARNHMRELRLKRKKDSKLKKKEIESIECKNAR